MEWIADPTAWLGLGTLILLEIVLGVDNLVFIAILVDKLPPHLRKRARILGLSLALLMRVAMLGAISWLQSLSAPVLTFFNNDLSIRDLILIAGGLFLLLKATTELHGRLEARNGGRSEAGPQPAIFWQTIVQIVILDFVFSIDSVVTAVGMVDHLSMMIIAVFIAILAMMFASGPLTSFVSSRPTVVVLALGFLLMIGLSLFAEGWGFTVPKGYLYSAIAFSIAIETLNQIATRNRRKPAVAGNLRSRTAEAVLRILGGVASARSVEDDVSSVLAAGSVPGVFAPAERAMVGRVLGLADRPVRTIMTRASNVTWLDVNDRADALSRRILAAGHAAYPVCRGRLANLLGVARAPDLICDLLRTGRIDPQTLETKPLTLSEEESVLQLVEKLRGAEVPMAIVNDKRGALSGVVTTTDLLETILGEKLARGQHEQG
jgi:predicted tellurium resistance membrane protein TerC